MEEEHLISSESVKKDKVIRQKLMEQLKSKKLLLRQSLAIIDAAGEGAVDYRDFKAGLRGAGVVFGENDYKGMWELAGGTDGGKVPVEPFLTKIDASDQATDRYLESASPGQFKGQLGRCVGVVCCAHITATPDCCCACVGLCVLWESACACACACQRK